MNVLRSLIAPLVVTLAATSVCPAASAPKSFDFQKIAPKVAENVSELLERAHYSKRKLDDGVSKQLLKNFLERLDVPWRVCNEVMQLRFVVRRHA